MRPKDLVIHGQQNTDSNSKLLDANFILGEGWRFFYSLYPHIHSAGGKNII